MNNNHYSLHVLIAIAAVKEHIEKYPLEHKRCEDLLESITTLNRRVLEKAFKDVYGSRIKEYQVQQRLEVSKIMLRDGMPKKLVAVKCFYSSQSAFSTAFKKEFDMTPTDWLKTVSLDITATDTSKM